MTAPQLITRTVKRCRSEPSPPQRLYRFAVTSLAMFLVGQIVWRAPIAGYVASAKVEYDCSASDAESPPREVDVQKLLASDSTLGHLLEQVDHLRSYIRIRTIESSGSRSAYEIRIVGSTTDEATELANTIAKHLASLSTSQYDLLPLPVKNAEAELLTTRRRENDLRQELSALLTEHCDSLVACLESAEQPEPAESGARDDATETRAEVHPEMAAVRMNPQWLTLNHELVDTQQKIKDLRVERTDQHPLVTSLNLRALELKGRLSRIPRTIETISPRNILAQPKAMAEDLQSIESAVGIVASPSDDLANRLERLTHLSESLAAAQASRIVAEDRLVQVAAQQPKESRTKVAITPATIVASIGGRPPLPRLFLITLISISFGGAVSMLAAASPAGSRLQNADGPPGKATAGLVDRANPASNANLHRLRRAAWIVTRVCELAVVGLVGLVVVIALSDSPLAVGFFDAPFQTLSEAIQRIAP